MIVRALDEHDLVDQVRLDPRQGEGPSVVRISFATVRRVVGQEFGLPEACFTLRSRRPFYAWRRFAVVFWARFFCKEPCSPLPMSYPNIAQRLGLRDHTTAMHGWRRAKKLWAEGGEFGAAMDRCWLAFQELSDGRR
ncbi:chromosomal replication initiator protein DnaA [Candidatus Phycosocius bacilliformis]|uniref:Chromosomal replication initiator protein DnaA n=1 Tax=Candidatus Phycosocius bacilliformis TaxID=1445552 RepID=A0A2P2E5T3_9PROT|nr:hypothetical protein [Candidatus Phycosocius bacilliformis]GBF56423.1 chromosomal replication initiator protein DnaA [Candidatus Phycosocius bacilliformis]